MKKRMCDCKDNTIPPFHTVDYHETYIEPSEEVLYKIAEQVKEGYTSGKVTGADGTENAWEIKVNTWKN